MFLLSKVVRINLFIRIDFFAKLAQVYIPLNISPAKIVFSYKLIIESEFSDAERTGLPT